LEFQHATGRKLGVGLGIGEHAQDIETVGAVDQAAHSPADGEVLGVQRSDRRRHPGDVYRWTQRYPADDVLTIVAYFSRFDRAERDSPVQPPDFGDDVPPPPKRREPQGACGHQRCEPDLDQGAADEDADDAQRDSGNGEQHHHKPQAGVNPPPGRADSSLLHEFQPVLAPETRSVFDHVRSFQCQA